MESVNVSVTREEVQRFLSIKSTNGEGCGCGCGSGDGYCYGNRYGYGDGYGPGSGYSTGSGGGDGCVYNYGNGCGDSNGSGDGSGFSEGYGSEDGSGEGGDVSVMNIKTFNGHIIDYIDGVPTIITNIHNNVASGFIIGFDMTLIPCYVAKAGNSFAHGKTLKDAVKDAEAKEMGEMPIEERIEKFIEVFGSLDSEHMSEEFYDWHHILTGSCRMGRDKFCEENGIDLTKKYSVRYFLNITKNSYGGDIIKRIINELTKEKYGTI